MTENPQKYESLGHIREILGEEEQWKCKACKNEKKITKTDGDLQREGKENNEMR